MASKRRGSGSAREAAAPRRPKDVAASALANEEFVRQLEESLEEERQGIPPIPFRRILLEETEKRRSQANDA